MAGFNSMADVSDDDIPLAQLQNEAGVESDTKHGIKRSRSPSPLSLQGELQKRSKQKVCEPLKFGHGYFSFPQAGAYGGCQQKDQGQKEEIIKCFSTVPKLLLFHIHSCMFSLIRVVQVRYCIAVNCCTSTN